MADRAQLVPLLDVGEGAEEEEEEEASADEVERVFSPAGVDIFAVLQCAASPKDAPPPALDIKSRFLYFSRFIPNFVGFLFCQWAVEHKVFGFFQTSRRARLTLAQFVANADQGELLGQFMLDKGFIKAVAGRQRGVFRNEWTLYSFCVVDHPELFSKLTAKQRNYLHKGKARHVKARAGDSGFCVFLFLTLAMRSCRSSTIGWTFPSLPLPCRWARSEWATFGQQ
jgi:hypothetical protein